MELQATDLFARLRAGDLPAILDVRNEVEAARWRIEGRTALPSLNLPYFAFLEDEAGALAKVRAWRGEARGPMVAVCAKGDSSAFVAELLCSHGVATANLAGGMQAWGSASAFTPLPAASGLRGWQELRFGKGCAAYVLAEGRDAVIVDPHRDAARYVDLLAREGLTLRHVVDTHLHADHVSGGAALARSTGASYWGHPADFGGSVPAVRPLVEGTRLWAGGPTAAVLRAMHGPGHTPGSTLLLVQDAWLFTGDALFVSGVGRPDLGGQAAAWAADLHETLTRRIGTVADEALVLPAHCAGHADLDERGLAASRLGELRRCNPLLRAPAAEFVRTVVHGCGTAPAHYARIRAINLGGIAVPPEELEELELGRNECAAERKPS